MKTLTVERGLDGVDAARVLRLWHLLSLDAPTVAALWTVLVARVGRVELPWNMPVAMFAAVWVIYAADRLLDARRQENLEARHRFHGRHQGVFVAGLLVACGVLLPLIFLMPAVMLRLYVELGGLLLIWLGVIHLLPGLVGVRDTFGQSWRIREQVPGAKAPMFWRREMSGLKPGPISKTTAKAKASGSTGMGKSRPIPKEIAVGVFFGAAIFVPTAASVHSWSLFVGAVVLANLCSLNCLFIYAWEHPVRGGGAHASTRFGMVWLREIAVGSVVIPLALIAAVTSMAPILMAASAAAGVLLLLDRTRGRMERTTLRAAADAALLTPLLVLPFVR